MLINLIYAIVRVVQDPGWDRAEYILLAVGLILLMLITRLYAVRNQDRVIRLEERLRFERLLPADLAAGASDLNTLQIVALRFAGDAELEDLVRRTLDGEFEKQKDIKLAVKNWRADFERV